MTSRPNPKRSHQLRYVLRNRATSDVYLVVLFTLYLKEDVNEDGSLKPAALQATAKASCGQGAKGKPLEQTANGSEAGSFDEEKALDEARSKLEGTELGEDKEKAKGKGEVNDDDVD